VIDATRRLLEEQLERAIAELAIGVGLGVDISTWAEEVAELAGVLSAYSDRAKPAFRGKTIRRSGVN
jgi:hypothetical protein